MLFLLYFYGDTYSNFLEFYQEREKADTPTRVNMTEVILGKKPSAHPLKQASKQAITSYVYTPNARLGSNELFR